MIPFDKQLISLKLIKHKPKKKIMQKNVKNDQFIIIVKRFKINKQINK